MNQSFYTALTGSKSFQKAIDITSNNIANVSTIGYKSSTSDFSSLFAKAIHQQETPTSNDLGYGTKVNSTSLDLRDGSYQVTENVFDMALSGEGWFGILADNQNDAKEIAFTRNGTFSLDKNSQLVTSSGNYVLGAPSGNLIKDANQNWTIDPNITPLNITSDSILTALTLPKEIIHPPIATSLIDYGTNLSSSPLRTIDINSDFNALRDQNGNLYKLRDNQDLFLVAGNDEFNYDNLTISKQIRLSKDILDNNSGSITFTLQDTPIVAKWEDGASSKVVSESINNAIKEANIENLSTEIDFTGEFLTIKSSTDELKIANSSKTNIIDNSYILLANYKSQPTAPNDFSSAKDFLNLINKNLSIYPNGSYSNFLNSGKFQVNALENIDFNIKNSTNSNQEFINSLFSLTGTYGSGNHRESDSFNKLGKMSTQSIIGTDGKKENLVLNFTENAYNDWSIKSSIEKIELLTKDSDFGKLINPDTNSPLNLKESEELWLSTGRDIPIKTELGYGFKIDFADDVKDSLMPYYNFFIDDKEFRYFGKDGDISSVTRDNVRSVLDEMGYRVTTQNDYLIVHPKNDKLVIKDATTNISGVELNELSLQKISYTKNKTQNSDISTMDDFLTKIDDIGSNYGLTTTLKDGKIGFQNSSEENTYFTILAGNNTDKTFFNIISRLSTNLKPNDSITSDVYNVANVTNEITNKIIFDESGNIQENQQFSFKENGRDLNVNLTITTNSTGVQDFDQYSQNGVIEGVLENYNINTNGEIFGQFSNSEYKKLGTIGVYHFQNDQGLEKVGNNSLVETDNSGKHFFYFDKNGEYFSGATVSNKQLENSNVSTQIALTELILFQRSFDGAAKLITSSNEMIQNAINMKK